MAGAGAAANGALAKHQQLQPGPKKQLLPPAQPVYVLRGHASAIHSIQFIRHNSRLVTGDAEGWIVLWDTATRRPVAVWKAHDGAILGTCSWGGSRIITHGRDNRLFVWELNSADEALFNQTLPVDEQLSYRRAPWLLHALHVNTLNFCAFATCSVVDEADIDTPSIDASQSILVAVPNALESASIDMFHLPSEGRIDTISFEGSTKTVLSLDVSPQQGYYFTSSADAILAKHPLFLTNPTRGPGSGEEPNVAFMSVQTKHAGQQSLCVRSDGRIIATAGWDARVRIYSAKNLRELAVLKWHNDGCYAVAIAPILSSLATVSDTAESNVTSRLSLEDTTCSATATCSGIQTVSTVAQRRQDKAQSVHWVAAGSKDGKVSLWDLY
ncbi:MAG: ASTRA complex subunit [Trizodia sp. TS-e1964]|nr:MAG: ASTRA complex subunit [Trizodia sp. TS-e1964]